MGGKPSQLLGPRAPLWQGGKKPLGEGDSFFDDAEIGAAVSLGVTAVDPARHPNIKRRLRLPVADEPAAAGALAAKFEAAALFVHDARLAGDPVYVHCARGVSRSSAVSLAYALAARGDAFPTVAAARTWLEERRPAALPNVGFLAALEAWVTDGGRDACAAKLRALEIARPAAAAALAASDAASVDDALRRAERRATEAVDDDDGGARRWMKVVKGARGDLGGRVEVVVDAPRAALQDAARAVADDVGGLWLPASRRVAREAVGALSPLRFSRDFVGASQPLIVRLDDVGPLDGLDALRALERDDATPLTVSATPDGRADSIRRGGDLPDGRPRLAMPEERKLTPAAFLRALRSKGDDVLYYSAQNGSLGECAAALGDAVPASALPAPFLEALAERGAPAGAAAEPEAVNVWLGDSRSTTAAHRDRAFENLYLVLAGCKRFLLLPPSAAAYLKSAKCVPARWAKHGHGWHLRDERGDAVDWLDVDLAADLVDDDGRALPRPAEAVVRPGEVLYLPAGWIHQVEQHDDTLAVNWWFPARLDGPVWAVGRLADQVGELRNRNFR